VNRGRFRPDLYFRLAGVKVTMPPLRERLEDLPQLVDALLERISGTAEALADVRSREFVDQLSRHPWPGNIRELRHYLERCVALKEIPPPQTDARAQSLPPPIELSQSLKTVRERWVHYVERRYLEEMLQKTGNNVSEAARQSGIDRIHFYRLLNRSGLR